MRFARCLVVLPLQEKGNTKAQWWCSALLTALGGERGWHRVGLRQLSGMLLVIFARNHLWELIGEIATASVACGVLGVGGNKGAVALEFSIFRHKVAVVCSHFAAHQVRETQEKFDARKLAVLIFTVSMGADTLHVVA